MEWLTFVIEVVKVVAWPGAAVLAVWILRRPAASVLQQVRQIRYKDLTINFRSRVRAAKSEVKRVPPEEERV